MRRRRDYPSRVIVDQPPPPPAGIPLGRRPEDFGGRRAYPGRTDQTEHKFEEPTVPQPGQILPPDPDNLLDPRNTNLFHLGTVTTGHGTEIAELEPACCHHGHLLKPPYVTVGWQPCTCGGHRDWRCWHPVDGHRCDDTVLWPPLGDTCRAPGGYGTRNDP